LENWYHESRSSQDVQVDREKTGSEKMDHQLLLDIAFDVVVVKFALALIIILRGFNIVYAAWKTMRQQQSNPVEEMLTLEDVQQYDDEDEYVDQFPRR
jgi:hypothetical protein